MSRSDQYIGLTDDAKTYVAKAVKSERKVLCPGAFIEKIVGEVFHLPPPEGPNKAIIAEEVLQANPWSSGPMYFTNLKLTLVKEDGAELDMGLAFSWVYNPGLEDEFDPVKGHFNL